MLNEWILQVPLAVAYYAGLVIIVRLAGKRLAGQVATFDLVVLISLSVVLQTVTLGAGKVNAIVFLCTVFGAHRLLTHLCTRFRSIRRVVRGTPRPLVQHGQVSFEALVDEGLSYDELLAGLRKLGHQNPQGLRLVTLEETGHISAVPMQSEP